MRYTNQVQEPNYYYRGTSYFWLDTRGITRVPVTPLLVPRQNSRENAGLVDCGRAVWHCGTLMALSRQDSFRPSGSGYPINDKIISLRFPDCAMSAC
jgi:hypothetical protein